MRNRSAPPCDVNPVIAYEDPVQAAGWLEAAFGFRVRLRVGTHRVQMWFASGCLILGEAGESKQWATRSSVMLRVHEVDAMYARALAQAARGRHPPQTHPYGERQATLEDFAGHLWTLTQTIEDVDPASWGGEAVEL